MYIVGAPHPNKDRLKVLLEPLVEKRSYFVTDVETYQEILRRYASIGRVDVIESAISCLESIVDETWTFDLPDIRVAEGLLLRIKELSARDALHVAIMRRKGVKRILSFDRGFDMVKGIERLS